MGLLLYYFEHNNTDVIIYCDRIESAAQYIVEPWVVTFIVIIVSAKITENNMNIVFVYKGIYSIAMPLRNHRR